MDWLDEELGGYDDDYLIIDCPGTPVSVSRTSGRTYSEIQVRLNSTHITHSSLHLSATSKDSACERVRCISLNLSSWRTSTNSSGELDVYTFGLAALIVVIMSAIVVSSLPCPRWSISRYLGSTSCRRWTSLQRMLKTREAVVMV